MGISKKEVEYVARLARLKLTADEVKLLGKQLDGILSYIDKLKEISVEGIWPTTHVLPLKNVFREDRVNSSLSLEDVLRNAPGKKQGFFKVPPVLEEKGPDRNI